MQSSSYQANVCDPDPKVTDMLSMHTCLTSEKKFTHTVFSFSEKFCARVIGKERNCSDS